MGTFKEDLVSTLDDTVFDTDMFAIEVNYAGSTIDANFAPMVDLKTDNEAETAFGELEIKSSDVAQPELYDSVIIESVTWEVRRILKGSVAAGSWLLEVYTGERPVI